MSLSSDVIRLKRRRTRIVATLGPASRDPGTLRALLDAGVDVFRLNFSHGSHEEHEETFRRVRQAAEELGAPVAVLADLCGPKIRVGRFREGEIVLEAEEEVTVTTRDVEGEAGLIPSRYEELADDVASGDRILLDDGRLELQVLEAEGTEIRARVVRGGVLRDRKGMNLPGVAVSAPSLTPQDREDARFAVELGVDFLALSFVRRAEDVSELRGLVDEAGGKARLIAKIEKPEALDGIDEILAASDGIMVARGDLGVELPPEEVPVAQVQLVDRARRAAKPVIVATQMLESMVEHGRPTRAEVSDVAGAVMSGADAVMLSAETAAGAHPVEAVRVMDRVARMSEGYLWEQEGFGTLRRPRGGEGPPLPLDDALSRATAQLSRDLMVRAIVVLDGTGESLRRVSAARPQAPVVAPSTEPRDLRTANLLWGVVPVAVAAGATDGGPGEAARRLVRNAELAGEGDYVLEVGGFHPEPDRNAPAVRVVRV